jgi:hypothetical protein
MDTETLIQVVKMLDSRINMPLWAHTTLSDGEFIVNLRDYLQGNIESKLNAAELQSGE